MCPEAASMLTHRLSPSQDDCVMGCGVTVVRSALTSVLASDRFPSSVSFFSACFLPGKAGLPSTDQPAQGAEPLLREGAHPCGGQNFSVH